MAQPSNSSSLESEERSDKIREAINNCVIRRAEGESVSDESVIAAHPDLMPELAEGLSALRLIEAAQRAADSEKDFDDIGLHIRCPHCNNPFEVLDNTLLSDVACPSCGSHFSLVDDEPSEYGDIELEWVGRFKLHERLGTGAFGSVWRARDTELDRIVAVKIPRRAQVSAAGTEQFIREARAAAQLTHPNIVRVYEVGRHDLHVYIVSDLVDGIGLADWLSDQRATPNEAAELCATIAEALHHAHEHGVIHRDLKPDNILLDTEGEPHITDFGLAKREAAEITVTFEGKLLGTPAYMSPEQARGAAHHADRRSDVYSVGVILFELLTGERPFRGNTRMLLHQILMEDAPSPRKLNGRIPRDLETICLRCLEKDPSRRYQTGRELCDDLRRFLGGETVHARPVSRASRVWRWSRRNRSLAAVSFALIAALLTVSIAAPMVAVRSTRQAKAHQRTVYNLTLSKANDVRQEDPMLALALLDDESRCPSHLLDFSWHLLRSGFVSPKAELPGHQHAVRDLEVSPDGHFLATASNDQTIKLWNLKTGKEHVTLSGHHHRCTSVAFSPDGKTLVSAGSDGQVLKWNLTYRTVECSIIASDQGQIDSVTFSPDGTTLAWGAADAIGTDPSWRPIITLWDVRKKKVKSRLNGHTSGVDCVAFSHDGKFLTSGSRDRTVKLWNAETGKLLQTYSGHKWWVWSVVFSPDSETLASASFDHTIRLWDVKSGQSQELLGHANWVKDVCFLDQGKLLASASEDRTIRIWEVDSGEEIYVLHGHIGGVESLALSRSGKVLYSAGDDLIIKQWILKDLLHSDRQRNRLTWPGHDGRAWSIDFSPDSATLASAGEDGAIKLWDVSTGKLRAAITRPDQMRYAKFADTNELICLGTSGDIWLWKTKTKEEKFLFQALTPGERTRDDRSRGGKDLPRNDEWYALSPAVSLSRDLIAWPHPAPARVKILDLNTQRQLTTLYAHPHSMIRAVAFQGNLLATGSDDKSVKLWDISTPSSPQPLHTMRGHTGYISAIAFSSDGQRLASASLDRTLKVWDTNSGTGQATLLGNTESILCVTFSPDGATLATGSHDGQVALWDPTTGHQRARLQVEDTVWCVDFSPNGRALGCACHDGSITVWRL